MNLVNGMIGGVVGGLIGAAIWAGIAYGTGYEIGWIAWGVGGLVGLGAILGGKKGSAWLGTAAVTITVLAILSGKYAATQLFIAKEIGTRSDTLQRALAELENDELVISYLADAIVEDRRSRGEEVEWPEGVEPGQASKQADYPPEIWSQAASGWEKMSDAEREDYRASLSELARQNIDAVFADISKESFLNSFSAMDLLFFGLAVVTAYKIAAPAEETASPSEADSETNGEDESPQE